MTRPHTTRIPGLTIAGKPASHPGDMDHIAAVTPEPPPHRLPSGLSAADFEPAQVQILADWYADHLHHLADGFYAILRAMPPGVEPSTRLIGVNAAIIAKLLNLTPDLEDTRWHDMPEILGVRRADFCAQKNAVIAALSNRDHALMRR